MNKNYSKSFIGKPAILIAVILSSNFVVSFAQTPAEQNSGTTRNTHANPNSGNVQNISDVLNAPINTTLDNTSQGSGSNPQSLLLLPCTGSNASGCYCSDSLDTDCDLLPDIKIARAPLMVQGSNGVIEYSQSGNGANDGRLRISVSTPNIGLGPLEIQAQNIFVCGTDTFPGPAPAQCPDLSSPHQLIRQRVYHKNGAVMTTYDRDAGAMTYHASHGHMHVDNWGEFSLRKSNGNPDPLTWPIYGNGAKLAFCLMDYGTCSTYNGHCVSDSGAVLTNGDFPNHGLGGGAYTCSNVMQGISSGYTDIYYQSLDGMWIDIPPGVCNGDYYIVASIDPENFFLESNENNNVMAVPFTLTKQGGIIPTITATGPTQFCPGGSVTLSSSIAGDYLWSNGATTQSIVVSDTGSYTVTTDPGSACPITSSPIEVSHLEFSIEPANPEICPGDSIQLQVNTDTSATSYYTIGSGTTSNGSQSYPAPYGNYYWGAKHQFLILASELLNSGMTAGDLTELAFDVSNVNSAPVHQNFIIKLGTTTLTSLTTFQTGLTTVLNPVSHQPTSGWNTHIFDTPFNWDGSSNIIVEVCFQNTSWVGNGNASVRWSSQGYTSSVYLRLDAGTVCGSSSLTGTSIQRPNIRFGRPNTMTYTWTPTTGLSDPAISNPYAKPATSTNYTVNVNNLCNSTGTVTVTVNSCNTASVNINAFLQGFYLKGGTMKAVSDPLSSPGICDTITLYLANVTAPYNITDTLISLLHTDGTCTFSSSSTATGVPRYLILRHRNSLETWSAIPVMINPTTNYNFTTNGTSAFGSNMVEVESGTYALWSGDIGGPGTPGIQDGVIDNHDMSILETMLGNLNNGYVYSDLTGDQMTEASDQSLLENNLILILSIQRP